MATGALTATTQEVIKRFDEAKKSHDIFVAAYNRRERSYLGVMQRMTNAAKWRHQLSPKHVFPLIETMVSNTIEQNLRFSVSPSPHVNPTLEEAQRALAQSESVEYLLRHQFRVDEMDGKQRPFFLCDAIGGRSVGKCYWNRVEGSVRRQAVRDEEVHSEEGVFLGHVPVVVERATQSVLRDHSTFEVVDPRDFVMHESARELQPFAPGGAQYVFHRCWYTLEQLRMLEASGYIKNVDQLSETRDQSNEYIDRDKTTFDTASRKGLIEVLEYWKLQDGMIQTAWVGNRCVELKEMQQSTFWHGEYPFVVSSAMPLPFSTSGMSSVELVEQIQEILWEITNQNLDNLELINNAIVLIRSDIEDAEAFPWFPGAKWPVTNPGDIQSFAPPYQLSELTLARESALKGDLQSITSAAPFAGGADTQIDQKTATGVSIIMSNAQRALAARKFQAQMGLVREANMRIKNCQQFLTTKQLVHIIGPDGERTFKEIDPLDLQAEYLVELEPMAESLLRQERRSEAIQLFQTIASAAPLLAATQQPLDMRQTLKYLLKQWGIEYSDQFFSSQAAALGAQGQPGQSGGGGGAQPSSTEPNLGITSSTAIDTMSPSAAGGITSSPVAASARVRSLLGGARNI